MKKPVFHFAFFALIGLILSPLTVAHASPPPADSVHFCAPFDYEQWERDHPRPAAKRLADLNVGEPRTVRMIYFRPNDRPYRQEAVDSMKVAIRRVQTFYGEQMEAHGYGNRTFRIETDAQGEPLVHRVDGQYPDSHYDHDRYSTYGGHWQDIDQKFDTQANNVYVVVTDYSKEFVPHGGGGRSGGFAAMNTNTDDYWHLMAHELGHAFGLSHDFRDRHFIMAYGALRNSLSACTAEFLAVHPYFNTDREDKETPPPTVELISSKTYPTDATSVSVQLKASDSDGLHQVILLVKTLEPHAGAGFYEVIACQGLDGKRDAVFQFDYDGFIPSHGYTSLSYPVVHMLAVLVVDTEDNVSFLNWDIASTRQIGENTNAKTVTLRGHTGEVRSVAFSPDGSILASGAEDGIKLWDVATRTNTTTFEHEDWVWSVAFSPDGATLASGARDRKVKLWDVVTRTNTATFEHEDWVWSVAFSPDGATLASGAENSGLKLWDVVTRRETDFPNLPDEIDSWTVGSVAFSFDDSKIALGLGGSGILYEIATGREIAFLGHVSGVLSVAFSPDSKMLASGGFDDAIKLWNVDTGQNIATLKGHGGFVSSVAFSPDSKMLAAGLWNHTIKLWNVVTHTAMTKLEGHTDVVRSVAFSPDGATLASGSEDHTIKLWDVSEWTRPSEQAIPHSLTKVSGDEQRGSAGTALAEPFVVSVLDQNGSAFAGVTVTFSVTAGEGILSSTTATTDANGQATTTLTLTLGSELGTNTVSATVEGLEPETFTATSVGQAIPDSLAKVSGDGQEGTVGAVLAEPFVVSVLDADGAAIAGAVVTFSVTAGGGTLSAATATTDANGQAVTRLTLGSDAGTNTVSATVEGLESGTFTATGQESPFASLFDLFGGGKLVALPDSPQLAQNAPNPFNSQTVLAYFLHAPSPARLEVFALTGQRVAILHQGPQQAGYHRLHWDGRDDAGQPLASGTYLYRLVADEVVLTRKLLLLR